MKIALVLGGGGARGLAHVGVLKALEREKIKIDLIVGCSAGAMIGAMYAQTPHVDVVEKRLINYLNLKGDSELGFGFLRKEKGKDTDYLRQFFHNLQKRILLNVFASRISILKGERLENAINTLVKPGKIENTRIPFACNATDLISGRPVLLTKGDIQKAVYASSAIPGYFPPASWNGKLLVDGAVTYNLPIKFARALGADFVIGVDVHSAIHREDGFENLFEVILRSSTIASTTLTEEIASTADLLISPGVGEFQWHDFLHYRDIIQAGEEAVLLQIEELRSLLPVKSRRTNRFFRLLNFRS